MNEASSQVFFSYARDDAEFALRLATDLRNENQSIWLDQLDISPGERWDRAVENALESSETVLVILSPSAVKSANVMDEVSYALEEGKRTIPVMMRECKTPFRLRRLQYVDFTSDYEGSLPKLISALGGEADPEHINERANRSDPPDDDTNGPYRQPPLEKKDSLTTKSSSIDIKSRRIGAFWGALIGLVYGAAATFIIYKDDQRMTALNDLLAAIAAYTAVAAFAGIITGLIVGKSPNALIPISVSVLVVILAWIAFFGTYADVVATGMVVGGGVTAIIVSSILHTMKKMRRK